MSFSYIFMGSCSLSLTILRFLWLMGKKPTGVFTASPKAQGRSLDIVKTPVQLFVEYKNSLDLHTIPIFTPETLSLKKNPENFSYYAEKVKALKPMVFVVASYGLLLPEVFLNLAPLGALNVHPSLLPLFRGSSPVPYTLFTGEKPGFSLMQMTKKMDAGPVFYQEEFPLVSRAKSPHYLEPNLLSFVDVVKDLSPLEERRYFFTPEEWHFLTTTDYKKPLSFSSNKKSHTYSSCFELPSLWNNSLLSQFLAHRSAMALYSYLCSIEKHQALPHLVPQEESLVTFSPKLTKEDGYLSWHHHSSLAERKTLGCYPWPKTRSSWAKKTLEEKKTEDILKDNETTISVKIQKIKRQTTITYEGLPLEKSLEGDLTLIFSEGLSLDKKDSEDLWLLFEKPLDLLEKKWQSLEHRNISLGSFFLLEDLWKSQPSFESDFFLSLSSQDQQSLRNIVQLLKEKASFGLLCGNRSFFVPLSLCPQGKKTMTGKAFSQGYKKYFFSF